MQKAQPKARRWPSRSPTGGTCGTTWPKLVERAVARHRSCLQEQPEPPEPGPPAQEAAPPPGAGMAARTRAWHAEIHAALAHGLSITEISHALRLDRKTVRRYATAATQTKLLPDTRVSLPSLLDPHQAYLRQRMGRRCAQH